MPPSNSKKHGDDEHLNHKPGAPKRQMAKALKAEVFRNITGVVWIELGR